MVRPTRTPPTSRRIRLRRTSARSSASSTRRGSPGRAGTSRTVVHSGRSMPCARSHSGYFAITMPRWSGATDPAFVLKHIGPKGGLIRIVPLLNAYRIDGKIESFARRRRLVAEVPQTQAVVTVDRLDDISLGVELYAHLAEIVAQQHADFAADGRVFKTRKSGLEHRAPLGDKTVVVIVGGIKQSSGQPRDQGRGRGDASRHGEVVGRPLLAQSR